MAEVLGVVSAAAQLATLCCSLLRLLKSIKTAPATLQNYRLQLQDISLLSSSISRNPLLQTAEIEALTQSLHTLISQTNLTLVLRKHRIIRAFYLFCNERDLVQVLSAVERQKLSLCLSIEHIQSEALYEIRDSLQSMSPQAQNIGKKRQPTNQNATEPANSSTQDKDTKIASEADRSSNMSTPAGNSSDDRNTGNAPAQNAPNKTATHVQNPPPGNETMQNASSNNTHAIQNVATCKITNVSCNGKVKQIVGCQVECDASELHFLTNSSEVSGVNHGGEGDQNVGWFGRITGPINTNIDLGRLAGQLNDIHHPGEKGTQRLGTFFERVTDRSNPGRNPQEKK